jgi:hypothetical protein
MELLHRPVCFVNRVVGLRAAVAIPSVSADEERRPDVFKVCFYVLAYHT